MTEKERPNTARRPDESGTSTTEAGASAERRSNMDDRESGVRHAESLEGAERLPRLGNELDKPFDDRLGE